MIGSLPLARLNSAASNTLDEQVGSPLQQRAHHHGVAIEAAVVQRRPAVHVAHVGICAVLQQHLSDLGHIFAGRQMQGCAALVSWLRWGDES